MARAVQLYGGMVKQMTMDAYKGARPVLPRPQILYRPDPDRGRPWFVQNSVEDYLLNGNAISYITVRGHDGWPLATQWLPAAWVYIEWSSYIDETAVNYYYLGNRLNPDNVVHVRRGADRWYPVRGVGVVEQHLSTLDRAAAEEEYERNTMAGASVPSVAVIAPQASITQEVADDAKDRWVMKLGGATREPVILPNGTQVIPLAWSPSDTQLIEARKLTLLDVANLFNLDGYWLGAPVAGMTYRTAGPQYQQILRTSARTRARRLRGHLVLRLAAPGHHCPLRPSAAPPRRPAHHRQRPVGPGGRRDHEHPAGGRLPRDHCQRRQRRPASGVRRPRPGRATTAGRRTTHMSSFVYMEDREHPGPGGSGARQRGIATTLELREVTPGRSTAHGPFSTLEGRAVPYGEEANLRWFLESHDGSSLKKTTAGAAKQAPLLLFHNNQAMPIGHAEQWTHTGDGLDGLWRLNSSSAAQDAASMADAGDLKGLSIGFVPIRCQMGVRRRLGPRAGPRAHGSGHSAGVPPGRGVGHTHTRLRGRPGHFGAPEPRRDDGRRHDRRGLPAPAALTSVHPLPGWMSGAATPRRYSPHSDIPHRNAVTHDPPLGTGPAHMGHPVATGQRHRRRQHPERSKRTEAIAGPRHPLLTEGDHCAPKHRPAAAAR